MPEKTSQILIRLPVETKQQLQIIAIKKHTNMNKILTKLIEDYIEKNSEV